MCLAACLSVRQYTSLRRDIFIKGAGACENVRIFVIIYTNQED